MTTAVIAEKPSVARDLAEVLGAKKSANGYLYGKGYTVSWALGHLVGLAEPHEMNPAWKRWQWDQLPIIPRTWPLITYKNTKKQFEIVSKLMNASDTDTIICATDAGREGELIFRYIYEQAECKKPVKRLWISSLTAEAIRNGLENLRDSSKYDALAQAARARSRADWLVGMNLSRAYTLESREMFSVGRVQTPTLSMLVERELAIRDFKPEDYIEVVVTLRADTSEQSKNYRGTYIREGETEQNSSASATSIDDDSEKRSEKIARLPPDGEEAERIVARAKTGRSNIESVEKRERRLAPPRLYDLTELQRHANRIYGFSANHTLEVAQSLYEKRKLISYPRTDSQYLSQDVAKTLEPIVATIRDPYQRFLVEGTGDKPLSSRFINDAKVTDHHAIIPTTTSPRSLDPNSDEGKLYDLICRRLLAIWQDDHIFSVTTVINRIATVQPDGSFIDKYISTGTSVEQLGWRALDIRDDEPSTTHKKDKGKEKTEEQKLPAGLVKGQVQTVVDAEAVKKKTRPPPHFTEATLLTGMETAGRTLDDKALSDAMRENGLGTPATRAAIIETLLKREYIVRKKKILEATDKGIKLIETVHEHVKSPAMTGEWERRLKKIEKGADSFQDFMIGIENYVREVVSEVRNKPKKQAFNEPRPRNPEEKSPRSIGHRDSAHSTPPSHPVVPFKESTPAFQTELFNPAPKKAASPDLIVEADSRDIKSVQALNKSAANSPVKPSAPVGPARMVLAVPDEPARGRWGDSNRIAPGSAPVLRDELAAVVAKQRYPGERLRDIQPPASVEENRSQANNDLTELLKNRFGFQHFLPHQENVCRGVTHGENVLLVMPTGAGKSLCYQLPGIARGGATLVVSPLIALMEDQVSKLQHMGFRARCIHSGRDRADSRTTCIDYLDGKLDFLFIAPERLGVKGFPEMLARRKPVLIAIDEAHCISQWGHDFRPDYRMLRERLPILQPAPVIALTATATPIVQDDIIKQLGVDPVKRYIHGFRRYNIAIEVIRVSGGERQELTRQILKSDERIPAIIYAPTRKEAESLAAALSNDFVCKPYHAGMVADNRERTQADFMGGNIDVIVATIAFGMGIDKPNVRTVIHTALPDSVESYYQEIGRVGRDGKPSRAVLMYSYADRRKHEFFQQRDYPEPEQLDRLFELLSDRPQPKEDLKIAFASDTDLFDKALDKLWIHRGAQVDPEENVTRGTRDWRKTYLVQLEQKRDRLERIARYTETAICRMLQLTQYFGDQEDSGEVCGQCDICAPISCLSLNTNQPSDLEQRYLERILDALRVKDRQASGKVFRDQLEDVLERRRFEDLVTALARAALIEISEDSFEKEEHLVAFRRLHLTPLGRDAQQASEIIQNQLRVPEKQLPKQKRKRKPRKTASENKPSVAKPAKPRKTRTKEEPRKELPQEVVPASIALISALKAWRLQKAHRTRVPAFRVLTDRVVTAIATRKPKTDEELLTISGFGYKLLEKYGSDILAIIHKAGTEG
jgi:DNA topoisomerase III